MKQKFSKRELFLLAVLKCREEKGLVLQSDIVKLIYKRFNCATYSSAGVSVGVCMKNLEKKGIVEREPNGKSYLIRFTGDWKEMSLSPSDLDFIDLAFKKMVKTKSTKVGTVTSGSDYPFSENQFSDEGAVPVSSPPPSGPKNSSEHLSLDDLKREEWKLFQCFVTGIKIPTETDARIVKMKADYIHELSQLSN